MEGGGCESGGRGMGIGERKKSEDKRNGGKEKKLA
jgi:hypothetical protein